MLPGLRRPAAAMQNSWCDCSSSRCIRIVWTQPHTLWYSTSHQPPDWADRNSTYLHISVHMRMPGMKIFPHLKLLQHSACFVMITEVSQRNPRFPSCSCSLRKVLTYVRLKSQKAQTGSYTVPGGFCRKNRVSRRTGGAVSVSSRRTADLHPVVELEVHRHADRLLVSQHRGGDDRGAQDGSQIPGGRHKVHLSIGHKETAEREETSDVCDVCDGVCDGV